MLYQLKQRGKGGNYKSNSKSKTVAKKVSKGHLTKYGKRLRKKKKFRAGQLNKLILRYENNPDD